MACTSSLLLRGGDAAVAQALLEVMERLTSLDSDEEPMIRVHFIQDCLRLDLFLGKDLIASLCFSQSGESCFLMAHHHRNQSVVSRKDINLSKMLTQLQRYHRRNLPLFINSVLTGAKEEWSVEEVDEEEGVSLFIPSKIVPAIPDPEPSYEYQVSLRTKRLYGWLISLTTSLEKVAGHVLEIIASRIDDRRRMIVLRVPGQEQREIRGALQFTGFAPGERLTAVYNLFKFLNFATACKKGNQEHDGRLTFQWRSRSDGVYKCSFSVGASAPGRLLADIVIYGV